MIYEALVTNRKRMRFLSWPQTDDQQPLLDANAALKSSEWTAPEEDEAVAERHKDNALQTPLDRDGLFRQLFALHNDSEMLLDEQGFRVLCGGQRAQ